MISYEASKWYVKLWRNRWYIYAIFLHIKNFLRIDFLIEYVLENELEDDSKKNLRSNWKEILHHIKVSKMYKFSSKINYERED